MTEPDHSAARDWDDDVTHDDVTHDDVIHADDGVEVGVEVGGDDLAVDPRTDAEALCLCSLLWTNAAAARVVVDALNPNDFYNTTYATLFDLITTQVRAGRPHDPASIVSAITIAGGGHHAQLALRTLTDVTIAGAGPESAGHYAAAVAAAAYRRGYIAAAASLTQAATGLAEADLFEHLLTIGRERRTALQRLEQVRGTLGH